MTFRNPLLNRKPSQKYSVLPAGHRKDRIITPEIYRAAAYLALQHSLSSHPAAQVLELEAMLLD